MLTQEKILDFLRQNKERFKQDYYITKLGLFGSFLHKENRDDSDVDILIELQDNTQDIFELKENLRQFIRGSLGRDVDIAREKYLKSYIKDKILKEAIYV